MSILKGRGWNYYGVGVVAIFPAFLCVNAETKLCCPLLQDSFLVKQMDVQVIFGICGINLSYNPSNKYLFQNFP